MVDGNAMDNIDRLREEIAQRESELAELKAQLAVSEKEFEKKNESWKWPLRPREYQRYGRQMIVPSFGLQSK